MSSRPALRPWLAAAKDFSHSFNPCRRALACSWIWEDVPWFMVNCCMFALVTLDNLGGLMERSVGGHALRQAMTSRVRIPVAVAVLGNVMHRHAFNTFYDTNTTLKPKRFALYLRKLKDPPPSHARFEWMS